MKKNNKAVWCIVDRDSFDGSIILWDDQVFDTRERAREALRTWKKNFTLYGGTLSVGKLQLVR
jgi:hypothetical protein